MSGQDYRVPPLSRDAIRALANRIRTKVKIDELYFPIIKFLEIVIPEVIPDFILEISPVDKMGGTHGLTFPQKSLIILREDVYNGADGGGGRDRMTVAHEIGHLLMHKNIAFARADPDVMIKAYESSEWQAKCFSGELLVPYKHSSILKRMSAIEISAACGVSMEAAYYHKNILNKNP